ncbi:hypothetical protein BgiBS90_005890 [Biomphalaria glabrata]|nr:hypothetical protein BgiBS90_005890 [Biomphalaria glabrata]
MWTLAKLIVFGGLILSLASRASSQPHNVFSNPLCTQLKLNIQNTWQLVNWTSRQSITLADYSDLCSSQGFAIDKLPQAVEKSLDINATLENYICALKSINASYDLKSDFDVFIPSDIQQMYNNFSDLFSRTLQELEQMARCYCPSSAIFKCSLNYNEFFTAINKVSSCMKNFFNSYLQTACSSQNRKKRRGVKSQCANGAKNCNRKRQEKKRDKVNQKLSKNKKTNKKNKKILEMLM